MSEKILRKHLQRRALVYIRQSSTHQVHHNQESKRLQYAVRERVAALGWAEVEVIDEDLGLSGTSVQKRTGFQYMMAQVCLGDVGAVAAREVSRFCRNNRDWHHLVELCRMFEALLIDDEAVYDASNSNDRLLLGLKGSLSEYELDLLRQRAAEARWAKAKRGELIIRPPVGFVKGHNDTLVKDPDQRVQTAIVQVFQKFLELGSARRTFQWLIKNDLELPVRRYGVLGLETRWRPATYAAVAGILSDPNHAGAYMYGRTKVVSEVRDGALERHQVRQPLGEARILIHDHHEGYISWETFERIQQMMRDNASRFSSQGPGAAKKGTALLVGLLRCRRCGCKLRVHYSGNKTSARYMCPTGKDDPEVDYCITFGAPAVDDVVSSAVLQAIEPGAIEAARLAADHRSDRRKGLVERVELDLKAARYDAERARKQYDATDPENRLVADELERRWELSMRHVRSLETKLSEVQGSTAQETTQQLESLIDLAERLKLVWHDPDVDIRIKKRILRTVIEEIVADVDMQSSEVVLLIHWKGGLHTEARARRMRRGQNSAQNPDDVVQAVRELAHVCDDKQIAAYLNRNRIRTGRGNRWTKERVASLRSKRRIPVYSPERQRMDGWMNLQQAAQHLMISTNALRRAVQDKAIPGLHPLTDGPWLFSLNDLNAQKAEEFVRTLRGHHGKDGPASRDTRQLNLINPTT